MAFQKAATQPAPRPAGASPTDLSVAGLFPGEVAVRLDTQQLVGVNVIRKRTGNGTGVHIRAIARWITGTGVQRLEADGDPVKAEASYHASMPEIERHTLAALSKEVALVALGEPPTMVDVPVDAGQPAVQTPMIPVADEVRLNSSIRKAIALATEAVGAADTNAILGLV